MSDALQVRNLDFSAIESVILQGDLSKLSSEQRGQYVAKICEVMGLNPLTKPFEFMTLNGKLTCYAGKNCAEQLRRVHQVSSKVTSREKINDVYVVTVDVKLPNGREDSSTGVVSLIGLKGDALANAMMKAETKAKRRATLSICGLGMLDETEVETIPDAKKGGVYPSQPESGDGIEVNDGVYRVPGGQYYKRGLHEIDPKELAKYIDSGAARIAKNPEKKPAWWDDFVTRAEQFLGDLENQPIEVSQEFEKAVQETPDPRSVK